MSEPCVFDKAESTEPRAHPIVQQSPNCTRDALQGCKTEVMRLHYKARENETIQYLDVMNFYPYICKYFKFSVGHPIIHLDDPCKDEEACLRMYRLIKCSIVPPERLYDPLPPFHT